MARSVPVDEGLTFTDGFCGAGGSSEGLKSAGGQGLWAANHNPKAILVHSGNHGEMDHEPADLHNYDWRRAPRARVAWWSPACTWHSPAGGMKRLRGQMDLLPEHVTSATAERSRMTMMNVIEATQVLRNDIVIVENVVEVGAWLLFDHWLAMMKAIGYQYRSVCVNSAHVWDEDNPGAPQMRDRWYGVFVRNGIRMPDLDLRPLAWCNSCGRDVRAKQSWRNPTGRRMGKYKQTVPWADGYDYRCPEAMCRFSIVEPYTRPASTIIDWSNLGELIGPRIEKMKPNTLMKVQDGLDRFGPHDPLMISVTHGLKAMERTYRPGYSPFATRTTKIGDGLLVPPAAAQDVINNTPFIVTLRNNGRVYGVTQSPTMTFAARGKHHALVTPEVVGHRPDGVPIVKASEIGNCRFRMTTWREAFSAQRFPPDYWVPISTTGRAKDHEVNGTTATMLAGNAVSVSAAFWLMMAVQEVL